MSRKSIPRSSVLIAGVARNCETSLGPTLDALSAACAGFAQVECLIVESDSTDETLARAKEAAAQRNGRVETLGTLRDRMPRRIARLVHCRNHLRDIVESNYGHVDYVILADMDGVNEMVTRAGIESAWSLTEDWGVVTANQAGGYYDIWALRHPNWCPGDCWADNRFLRPLIGKAAARQVAIHSRQIALSPGLPPIEVESAFGGLAIYKREAFLAGRYAGLAGDGTEICEHVPFHADLRKQGHRIYINPAMLNRSEMEHRKNASLLDELLGGISRLVGRG